jgi:hypothetical protein
MNANVEKTAAPATADIAQSTAPASPHAYLAIPVTPPATMVLKKP